MSSVLQQTLRGLCFDTGWCYAVFWKLKRQARTVLTWEDAYYGPKREDANANPSAAMMMPGFGQQMCGGLTEMEDLVGVSVAKMSYHVYSVGEGIIGRVAFTNKHQWVFSPSDKGATTDGVPNRKANPRVMPEKYPSGWENQFAAGIKTIAVIAVPQGVVQLGSTRMIAEDLKLIGHVKALFGTLQNVPGVFLSDLVTDVQRGTVHTVYPLAVPAPRNPVLMNIASPSLARTPTLPATMGLAATGVSAFHSSLGCSVVGRLPVLLPAQQMLTHAHSMPSSSVLGFQGSFPHFQHSQLDRSGLESLSWPSFTSIKPSCTWTGPIDMGPGAKVGSSLQHGNIKPPFIASPTSTASLKAKPPPRTGIISQLPLCSNASSIATPVSTVSPSPQADHPSFSATCSFTGSKRIDLPSIESLDYLKAHGKSRPVWRMESPELIGGQSLVAAELSDMASSVGSPKVVITTTKENPICVVGRSVMEMDTQSTDCGASIESRQVVGAKPPEENPQLVPRRSAESWHLNNSTHSTKCWKLDSSRPSTESQQLNSNRSSVDVQNSDWSRAVTESGLLVSDLLVNQLAGESPLLVSSLPPPAESLELVVDRPFIDGDQLLDNSFSVQGKQLGGAAIAKRNFQPASEGVLVESSQPCDSTLPISSISDVFGGHYMHLERGTTVKQDLCAREFLKPLPSEKSLQTSASERSHLTVQMSDLLQLAKQFENADSDHTTQLSSSGKVDLHESISSSLLCDDYFENLQFSMPILQNPESCAAEDFGSVEDSLTQNLFTSELDDFDEFFAWLTKTERSKSDMLSQPDAFCASTKYDEILAPHTAQDCGVITKRKEQCTSQAGGSNTDLAQIATAEAECEPILHTPATDQLLFNWPSANEVANTQSKPHVDTFVNSRIDPQVSVPCSRPTECDTEVGAFASMQQNVVKRGKKRSQPGEGDRVRSRQQIQDRIRELRAMVPNGARCSIDTLLEKTVEYTNVLQTLSQDSGEPTQSTKIHDGGSDIGIGSEVTSFDASWVMDFGAQGRACPILVENLSQPRQMLVEMLCEERGIFLQVADTLKSLGLTILKGVMEARNEKVWARFVIKGPEDVHRVQVLWALMQLCASDMTR